MIRVLLIDDHEMVRLGLSAYLTSQPDMEVVGEAAGGEEGIHLALSLKPDVIMMDLVMEGVNGIEATRRITEKLDTAKIIVLTSFIDDDKVYPVLEAGALSYLLKTSKAHEIAEAIRQAAKGESVLSTKVTGKMLNRIRHQAPDPHDSLTDREMEILKLIASGRSNQEIADTLYITVKTVKSHLTNIFSKLEVEDRTQAAIYAHRNGLAD